MQSTEARARRLYEVNARLLEIGARAAHPSPDELGIPESPEGASVRALQAKLLLEVSASPPEGNDPLSKLLRDLGSSYKAMIQDPRENFARTAELCRVFQGHRIALMVFFRARDREVARLQHGIRD